MEITDIEANNSRKFCGVAQMASAMDWVNTDEHWVEDSWQG